MIFQALLFISHFLFAPQDSTNLLNEVVVAGNKFEQKIKDSPSQIILINSKTIQQANTPNAANLLEQTGSAFVQRSQAGGGSPILRGFEASRILLVIDGVRMNNAIFRAGHLQNILRIDQGVLERAEVVFGPSSVIYGSDALGGVVHFKTRNAELNKFSGNAYVRMATAFGEKTGHFDFNLGGKKLASLTSFSFSNFGDLRMGESYHPDYQDFGLKNEYVVRQNGIDAIVQNKDPFRQVQSGYKQYDFLQKLGFQTGSAHHSINFQLSNTSNVPRYDRLTETTAGKPRFAEWYYGPEQRMLAAYHLDLERKKLFTKGQIVASFQNIQESRFSRRLNEQFRKQQFESVDVYALNADFQKVLRKHTFQYGFELTHNNVRSVAELQNVDNKLDIQKSDTRYPDGKNTMQTFGLYVANVYRVKEKVQLTTGMRYTQTALEANFIEKQFFPFPFSNINQQFGDISGNIGLVINPVETTKIATTISRGFRAPNIDDLAKVFDSTPTTLIVPNPNLKPEHTYNLETTISQQLFEKVQLEMTYFNTWFRNAIVINDFTFNGQATAIYNNQKVKVVAAQNTGKAFVNGFSGNLKTEVIKHLFLTSSINVTKGVLDDDQETPLDHIPPMYGRTGLKYQVPKFFVETFSVYNGWKKLKDYSPNGEDNLQYATKDGMPAWWTLNVRGGYNFLKNTSLQVSVENVFDKNYRTFASGISAAGRNIVLTIRGGF